jgi:hypothetical protein
LLSLEVSFFFPYSDYQSYSLLICCFMLIIRIGGVS